MLSGIIPACFHNAVQTSNFQPLEVVSRGSVEVGL